MFDHEWNLGFREPGSRAVCSISLSDLNPLSYVKPLTNKLGITNAAPADVSQGPDVQAQRDFAAQLRTQYAGHTPGAVAPVNATYIDPTQADQSRDVANKNLTQLQGVADGSVPTAADALLTKGTDAAAKNASGLAAAYSRGNPGLALRAGLAGGAAAYAGAASTAAAQKAQEQAQARGEIGSFADAMRTADLGAAKTNADIANNTEQFNTGANLQQQGLNNNYDIGKGNQVVAGNASPVASDYASQQALLENQKNNQAGTGSLITTLGALSDKRAKTDIKPASLADALAKDVHGVSFAYKGGMDDSGKHVGVLAQDVEKALPGAVKTGADGLKRVDVGHAALGTMGAVSDLARRLRALEGKANDDEDVKWGPSPYAREPAAKPITMSQGR